MPLTTRDIVPLSHARSHLSELADEVQDGTEKIITKNGESYVALIDAAKLDYYHQLELERGQLRLVEDLERGLSEIDAGKVVDARRMLQKVRRRRAKR